MGYQRKFLRAPVCIQAILSCRGELYPIEVYDMSEGGLKILSPIFLPEFSDCMILMALPNHPEYSKNILTHKETPVNIIRLRGEMISEIRDINIHGYIMGFEFYGLNYSELEMIRNYILIASKNLNYLRSIEDSDAEKLSYIKAKLMGELKWFDPSVDYRSQLLKFQKNLSWS